MIKISAQQLSYRFNDLIKQQKFMPYYLLVGAETYQQYQSQKQIQHYLTNLGFHQQLIFSIDAQTDWRVLYEHCQSLNLFASKTLLILQFGDNSISTAIASKLHELTNYLHQDIALLVSINKLTKAQENSAWLQAIGDQTLWINCQTLNSESLPNWLNQQAKQLGIVLNQTVVEGLCYYYEGNLLALSQILEQIKLLYPNGDISFNQIENVINDVAVFSPYHWLDAILIGKPKRTIHILQQLKTNDFEPLILLRVLQKELILLINLKQQEHSQSLKQAFNDYKIWQNRRSFFTQTLNRLTIRQLYTALYELTQIEISLKQDYSTNIWLKLESLSLLLLNKPLPYISE
ncbi:MAG: DNA polymerase III subunit delta [Candidatus Schmidhempelia sp.]|nr:DNA polymerase III subunit delta [Candidatus Schmidhempelia sp.]